MTAYLNPFRTKRLESIDYLFESGNLDNFLVMVKSSNYRGAIIGPKGCGKTTLLLQLGAHLRKRGERVELVRFNSEDTITKITYNLIRSYSKNSIVLIDGAEQIPVPLWGIVKSRASFYKGLIITAHKAGRMPTLFNCRPSFDIACRIVSSLNPERPMNPNLIRQIYEEKQLNMRELLLSMYDLQASDLQ